MEYNKYYIETYGCQMNVYDSARIKNLFEDRAAFIKASYAATEVIHRNLGSATRIVRNLIHD